MIIYDVFLLNTVPYLRFTSVRVLSISTMLVLDDQVRQKVGVVSGQFPNRRKSHQETTRGCAPKDIVLVAAAGGRDADLEGWSLLLLLLLLPMLSM